MKVTITKIDNSGTEVVWEGDVSSLDEAFDIYTDAIIDRKADDYCLWQDYTRILDGHNKLYRDKCMGWLKRNGKISETFLTGKYSLELSVDIHDDWDDDDDWELFSESWDPKYDDQPVNQYGEKWERLSGTFLNSVIESIMKDIQIDPTEDGPKMERMSLGDLHICEDGHLIAEIYGGANGGGFRGKESNWPYYMSLVRKFLGKLLDYDNGNMFKDVWMVDWNNDCCDDVWTLRLGITLSDKEKLQLIECGKMFSVVDPTQLDVSLDAAVEMVNPLANDAIEIANAEATVSESRKRK